MVIFVKLLLIFFIIIILKSRIKVIIDNAIVNNIEGNSVFIDNTPQIINILNRNIISLNGKWNYIIDVQEMGIKRYFLNNKVKNPEDLIEYDFDKSPEMEIPSDWNTKEERLLFYEGTIWFKKSFNYKQKNGKRVFLYFGAINYEAVVYFNKKFLGRHIGGFTPFNYEITGKINKGENFVIIKVSNERKIENIPTLAFDWWNYGGITRDVYIVETENVYIENYKFFIDKNDYQNYDKIIYYKIKLNSKISKVIAIYINELNVKITIKTKSNGEANGSIKVKNLELWSPENPKLYKIELKLGNEILKDEIGFRIIETKGKKILLNKKEIFLYGICLHEEKSDGGGRANSPGDAKKLLGWVKELGCNYVRLTHYPHNEYMIKEAEKMGILIWSEIPVYWTINFENIGTFENAKYQLKNMIYRDQNRANVIIWSIANETPRSYERNSFLHKLSTYARSLDNTRLISMALFFKRSNPYELDIEDKVNQYVDVISFNQYFGWYALVDDFKKIHINIPYQKPVIISEFGGGAKYGYHGEKNQRWTEEFQENLYIQNIDMIDRIDGLAGTSPWILKDFRSPRRLLSGIQDFYNMKGLISDKGEKKKAFYIVKKWYEKKKKEKSKQK